MAEERSDKNRWKSIYGGGWIASAQYLAEGMIYRQAKTKKKELPPKFWNNDEIWKRAFLLQVRFASALLKIYAPEAIIRALRTPQGKKIYSFAAKWLDPLIKVEQIKWEREQASLAKITPKEIIKMDTNNEIEKPREAFVKEKSNLSKLRDL